MLTLDLMKGSGPIPTDDVASRVTTDWKLHTRPQTALIVFLSARLSGCGTLIFK